MLYGLGNEPVPFDADERELRHALHVRGAVLELMLDGAVSEPAVVKDTHLHPVRGNLLHVDLLRVDLKKPIQSPVVVHLVGAEESPGVREGGVLEHVTRELTVEALSNDVPEALEVDVSQMVIGDRLTASVVTPPAGVAIIGELEEIVLASVHAPRLQTEAADEIETETGVVGQEAPEPQAESAADEE